MLESAEVMVQLVQFLFRVFDLASTTKYYSDREDVGYKIAIQNKQIWLNHINDLWEGCRIILVAWLVKQIMSY